MNHDTEDIDDIQCTTGVRQGGSLSSALFCLGYNRILSNIQLQNPNAVVIAGHDDVYLLGEPNDIRTACTQFETECIQHGLKLNKEKSKIYFNTHLSINNKDKKWLM